MHYILGCFRFAPHFIMFNFNYFFGTQVYQNFYTPIYFLDIFSLNIRCVQKWKNQNEMLEKLWPKTLKIQGLEHDSFSKHLFIKNRNWLLVLLGENRGYFDFEEEIVWIEGKDTKLAKKSIILLSLKWETCRSKKIPLARL